MLNLHCTTGTKLITFHGDLPYPSCEIIEKLESLDEEDVVGSGGFGIVYRMVMNDCGTFAVKKIDGSRKGSDQVFERELEILGCIKHINLVNLRGYCSLPTSKLLIYDFLAMGSLDDFLHGMTLTWVYPMALKDFVPHLFFHLSLSLSTGLVTSVSI